MKTMNMTMEEVIADRLEWTCDYRQGHYAKCPRIMKAFCIAGAIALQFGNIPVYPIRVRQVGFDFNGKQYKLRFRHAKPEGSIIELVEWDGYRDIRIIRTMTSIKHTHGILAVL